MCIQNVKDAIETNTYNKQKAIPTEEEGSVMHENSGNKKGVTSHG